MKTNRKGMSYPKDPIFDALLKTMTRKGRGYFIISSGPWIHPANTVMNCYAIMFDGCIQYKFEMTFDGYRVAEIRSDHYLRLPVTVNQVLSHQELIDTIKSA